MAPFLVGRAHALDEGADGVVVGVALFVVDDGFLLNAIFGDGEGEVDDTFFVGWCGEHAYFESVQAFARVTVGELGKMGASIVVDLHFVIAKSALLVDERAID
jgi:hypothetical protein